MKLILKILKKLRYYYWQFAGRIVMKTHGVTLGKRCEFYGLPIILKHPDSTITIMDDVVLCSHSAYTDLGVNHPVILKTLREAAAIYIDSGAGLSGTTICAAKKVHIGKDALIGANVAIFDTDFHAKEPNNRRYNKNPNQIAAKEVCIQDNVFIGTNVLICKGVTIGSNSIIGAGSVVVKDVEASKIYAGNPAREIANV